MRDLEISRVRSEDLPWVVETFIKEVYPDDPEAAQRHFADHPGGAVRLSWRSCNGNWQATSPSDGNAITRNLV